MYYPAVFFLGGLLHKFFGDAWGDRVSEGRARLAPAAEGPEGPVQEDLAGEAPQERRGQQGLAEKGRSSVINYSRIDASQPL